MVFCKMQGGCRLPSAFANQEAVRAISTFLIKRGNRRLFNGDQVNRVTGLALTNKPSVDFSGYWQRHITDQ